MDTLLRAVRWYVWRRAFVTVTRHALWAGAGSLLAIAVLHVTLAPMAPTVAASAIVLAFLGGIVWAALGKPDDAACALWADRHLAGASGYSTWLEMRSSRHRGSPAMRWLDDWTRTHAVQSIALLGHRHDPLRLSRPALAAAGALVILVLVLELPGARSIERENTGATPGARNQLANNQRSADMPAHTIAQELASALRPTEASQQGNTERDAGNGTLTASESDASSARKGGGDRAVTRTDSRSTDPRMASEDRPNARDVSSAASGSGREAGSSPDDRRDRGATPVIGSTIAAKPAPVLRAPATGQRAAMQEEATYSREDETDSGASATKLRAPAASAPPADASLMKLSPSLSAYVDTWMKLQQRR